MKRILLSTALADAVLAIAVLYGVSAAGQFTPYHAEAPNPVKKAAHIEVVDLPSPEILRSDHAIIRWTTTNPGGADQHYGIVHYGTDPKQLSLTAKSPVHLNHGHPTTIFRVMVSGLQPKTTYYYTVAATGSNGDADDFKSPLVAHFTTQ
jgi:hypothetical protein